MQAYLDNAATTKPCKSAVDAAAYMMTECWANPSSGHHCGVLAARELKTARSRVAQAMGAQPERIFFTSGGTEADNWAIQSTMLRMGKRGRHIITTAVEHHAVLEPMAFLESRGFEITRLQPDSLGCVSLRDFTEALRPDTVFASVMMVNNETGAVFPIAQMAQALHRNRPDAVFHTDAVQGLGKIDFKARTLGADLISVSAHKIHGIKGAGALYIRPGLEPEPYIRGGGQESGKRSGTEALPAICAFGAACSVLDPAQIAVMAALRDRAVERLLTIPGLQLIGAMQAPHIVCAGLPGARSQGILNILQEHGVFVSAGSACSKGKRSHVLTAMQLPTGLTDGAVRISLCPQTTQEEIDLLVLAMQDAAQRLTRQGR